MCNLCFALVTFQNSIRATIDKYKMMEGGGVLNTPLFFCLVFTLRYKKKKMTITN